MKINYVAYLNPFHHNGGGEMVLKQLLETGENRGHEFRISAISPNMCHRFQKPDLTILADLFNCPELFARFKDSYIENIIENEKYIHFDNAYVDCCNLPYLPCSGNRESECKYKAKLKIIRNVRTRDFSKLCFQEKRIIQKLYERSKLNIFVSPLHHKTISEMLKVENNNYYILNPLIDVDKFYDQGLERDIEYLYIGALTEAKGLGHLRSNFAGKNIQLLGKSVKGEKLDFGNHLGFVSYEKIPEYLNRTQNFVFLPRWPEPQGRVVVEAALCGCNLITNEMVGAVSFDFNISAPENLIDAEKKFWEKLESINHS